MTVSELEDIKRKISDTQLAAARAQGVIDTTLAQWKKDYNVDTVEAAEALLQEMKVKLIETEKRRDILMERLEKSYPWETI